MRKIFMISASALALGAFGLSQANIELTPRKSEPVQHTLQISDASLGQSARPMRMEKVPHMGGKVLNPEMAALGSRSRQPEKSQKEGFALYEDFEGWNGANPAWLPEGWTIDHRDSPASNRGWKITEPLSPYDYISSKCMTYEMWDNFEIDEWLVSPAIEITPGMQLGWSTMTSPYFYDIDFTQAASGELTEFPIMNDVTVNISTDGGQTWTQLFSHAESLLEETKGDFFAMFNYSVRPFSLSLTDYAGTTAMIGFRVSGREGNTTFIDDVSVGLPLTGSNYIRPLSGLFFGLSDTDENVPASIMAGPVYSPVTFSNNTKSPSSKSFTWTYTDTDGEQTFSGRNLTVTYKTDYTDAFSTRNNLYPFPVLYGSSATTAPDEFTYPGFFQAGGKGEYERHYVDTDEYEVVQLGLTVIDPVTEGSATYADIALPYFGYNQESDNYWSRYTFGNGADENNWNHLEKFGDFFYSPDSPIVISAIRTNAFGKVKRSATFTAEIYPLDKGYQIADEPIATATCTGDDITIIDRYSSSDFLSLRFTFDEPVVISKNDIPYFIVAIGGFRDPVNVEYFSPEMSARSNPNELGLGWLGNQMCWNGDMLPFSWSPVVNHTNDELVSFYIMLDAVFPWLETDTEEIAIMADEPAVVSFDSYYDASDLKIEGVPGGVTASAEGRYADTKVTFTGTDGHYGGTVTVKAPGVSKQITILGPSAITDVTTDADKGPGTIYTLTGVRVSPEGLAPGIYVVRYADGSAKKIRL